jgi:histidinol-phosphate phosphatase family protein
LSLRNNIEVAVILAGGLGERMRPITEYLPKALTMFNGFPILYHQLIQLQRLEISKVYILTGYLSDQISKYLSQLNLKIEIIIKKTTIELSPAQRILDIKDLLRDDFLLLYCDNCLIKDDVLKSICHSNSSYNFLLNKRNPGNIKILGERELDFRISRFAGNDLYVELGYTRIRNSNFFQILSRTENLSETFEIICLNEQVSFNIIDEQYFSASNINSFMNQQVKDKIIFLDRDGIINYRLNTGTYVDSLEKFSPVSNNWDFLRFLSKNGFYFVVITNQAGVALKKIGIDFLNDLHKSLALNMILSNINFLGIYFCPHHWEDECNCRKPRPGLITSAMEDLHLVGSNYLMIGDNDSDVNAGLSAGIKGFLTKGETFGYIEQAKSIIEEIYGVNLN